MAKTHDKQSFISETSPIIMRHDDVYDDEVVGGGTGSCGCFPLPCFGNRTETDRIKFLQQTGEYNSTTQQKEESWVIKKLKDLKEFSELVAGPKWKNFIRKFSKRPRKNTQFQYDPQSYALNFNDGGSGDGDEDDGFLARNFSTRFAPPASNGATSDQSRRPTAS